MEYDVRPFMRSCVALDEERTGRTLPQREVYTPFLDDEIIWVEGGERGELTDIARRVLVKVLYGARRCKYDIAGHVRACVQSFQVGRKFERIFLRFMMYITCAYVGDAPQSCSVGLFDEADFAGCRSTAKSTSGFLVAIVGPSTFFLVVVVPPKYDCVSISTTESEVESVAIVFTQEALLILDMGKPSDISRL